MRKYIFVLPSIITIVILMFITAYLPKVDTVVVQVHEVMSLVWRIMLINYLPRQLKTIPSFRRHIV
jgi:chromate transport protein ChrA